PPVVLPVPLCPRREAFHGDCSAVPLAGQRNPDITPEPKRDRGMPIDGVRQDETLVVIGVLAHDVDAARRDGDRPRRIAEGLAEGVSGSLVELVRGAHRGWANLGSNESRASLGLAARGS